MQAVCAQRSHCSPTILSAPSANIYPHIKSKSMHATLQRSTISRSQCQLIETFSTFFSHFFLARLRNWMKLVRSISLSLSLSLLSAWKKEHKWIIAAFEYGLILISHRILMLASIAFSIFIVLHLLLALAQLGFLLSMHHHYSVDFHTRRITTSLPFKVSTFERSYRHLVRGYCRLPSSIALMYTTIDALYRNSARETEW